jgi:hypothetical protein
MTGHCRRFRRDLRPIRRTRDTHGTVETPNEGYAAPLVDEASLADGEFNEEAIQRESLVTALLEKLDFQMQHVNQRMQEQLNSLLDQRNPLETSRSMIKKKLEVFHCNVKLLKEECPKLKKSTEDVKASTRKLSAIKSVDYDETIEPSDSLSLQ